MNFEITTKFNIGDEVFIPHFICDEYSVCSGYKVDGVGVYADNTGIIIDYKLKSPDSIITNILECSCFSTYAECSQWCKEQNTKDLTPLLNKERNIEITYDFGE